jgi:predicted enzyme related to lactoylglutathione lyase
MNTATYSTIKKMSPQLVVVDIDRSLKFYTQKLDFDVDFRYQDFYAGIIKDGFSIHLKSGTPSTEERNNKRQNEDLDIVFSVDGVEILYEQFLKKSVDIVQPLSERPYGKEFYIADPDGYIFGFLEETQSADNNS